MVEYKEAEEGEKEEEEIVYNMHLESTYRVISRLHLKKKGKRKTYLVCAEEDVDKRDHEMIAQEGEEEEEETKQEEENLHSMC